MIFRTTLLQNVAITIFSTKFSNIHLHRPLVTANIFALQPCTFVPFVLAQVNTKKTTSQWPDQTANSNSRKLVSA